MPLKKKILIIFQKFQLKKIDGNISYKYVVNKSQCKILTILLPKKIFKPKV